MRSRSSKTCFLASIVLLGASFAPHVMAAESQYNGDADAQKYRLEANVVPSNYEIKVTPAKAAGTFSGEEQIDIELKENERSIVLNAVDLEISHCSLEGDDKNKTSLAVSLDPSLERITLTPRGALPAGKYRLSLKFSGQLNKHLRGLYSASAKLEDKKEVALVATQFEPTDARRMFPCFDEPSFKATFNLSTVVDSDDTAISNAPIASQENLNEKQKLIKFSETPKMSTYLLALFVGPFKANEVAASDGVKVRVWSIGHPVAMGDYARDFAAKLLPFFHEYFGIAYPESKLDLVALPDFEAGAMENLGAISFRETLLLRDDAKDSLEAKMSLASVVAHEMSHMWFGDLVTMKWWDDLWLNEAFATWMSHKAIALAYPEWQTWEHLAEAKNSSMQTDALASSRAIHADVKNPAEAFEMFDEITYSKGASIIRMLELYVGADQFRSGVSDYLKSHRFGNASTTDLWKAIGEKSGKPVDATMHNWVYQAGFPLVSLETLLDGKSQISQLRFITNARAKAASNLWQVPTGLSAQALANRPSPNQWKTNYILLSTAMQSDDLPIALPFLLNAGGAGYYRSRYPSRILNELRLDELDTLDRFTLLTDQWALVRADKAPVEDYLALLASFKEEKEPFILETICEQFEELWNLHDSELSDQPGSLLSGFIREVLKPAKERLGWQERDFDSDTTKTARNTIIRTLGTIGQDPGTIDEAKTYFNDYLESRRAKKTFALPQLLGPIEAIVSYNGDAKTYSELMDVWRNLAETPSGAKRALFSLARFRSPDLINRTLALTLSEEVKIQDSPVLLASVISQKDGQLPALGFVRKHWEVIKSKYPPYMLPGIIGAAKTLRNARYQKAFEEFFRGNVPSECAQTFERTTEQIANNIQFCDEFDIKIERWLKDRYRNAGRLGHLKENRKNFDASN